MINFILDNFKITTENTDIVTNVIAPVVSEPDVFLFSDKKPAGTHGGAVTAGQYLTRDINTVDKAASFATLDDVNNTFTLQPGRYKIEISCPGFGVNRHKARLYNNTTLVNTDGTSSYAAGTAATTLSLIVAYVDVVGFANVFQIRHRFQLNNTTFGFGIAAGFTAQGAVTTFDNVDTEEVYTIGTVTRLGDA